MRDQVPERSRELFESGYYCAESVLLAISEAKGIKSELIPRIATGFCSGMARTGRQCGALSGGIMRLGLVDGRRAAGEDVDEIYAQVRNLIASFETKFGATTCSGLLGCNLGTEEGQLTFIENDLPEKCYQFTEESTRMAMATLENRNELGKTGAV